MVHIKINKYLTRIITAGIISIPFLFFFIVYMKIGDLPPIEVEETPIQAIIEPEPEKEIEPVPQKAQPVIISKPVIVPAQVETPKVETPSAPMPSLQQNNQVIIVPTPTNTPVIQVTLPVAPIVIQSAPAQDPQPQMPQEKRYNIKKGETQFQSNITLEEVRTFVASLNNYVSWRNKAKTASVEELKGMLSPNGYTLEE